MLERARWLAARHGYGETPGMHEMKCGVPILEVSDSRSG